MSDEIERSKEKTMRHAKDCLRANFPRKGDKCSCGFDHQRAREGNEAKAAAKHAGGAK